MFRYKIKRANQYDEYQQFIERYIGVHVGIDYMTSNQTYVLLKNKKVIGGYIFSKNNPFRYIESIKNLNLKKDCSSLFKGKDITEATCLWLAKDYRKSYVSLMLWLSIGWNALHSKTDYFLFGAIYDSLRAPLNYSPKVYKLLTTEAIEKHGGGYVDLFLIKRKHTLLSMMYCVFHLAFKPKNTFKKTHKLKEVFRLD